MRVPVWRQHDGASVLQDTCQCIPEKASGNWIHTSGGFILQNKQWSILVVSNRPFAACHSRGTKPPCWDANVALGQDQQKAYIILNANFLFFWRSRQALAESRAEALKLCSVTPAQNSFLFLLDSTILGRVTTTAWSKLLRARDSPLPP